VSNEGDEMMSEEKITDIGEPMTIKDFLDMVKRMQKCKDNGESVDSILDREYVLNKKPRTKQVRCDTFVDTIWNNENLTWINLNCDNDKGIKQKFSKLPIGAPYKCVELDEVYYYAPGEIYDWTEEHSNRCMNIKWY